MKKNLFILLFLLSCFIVKTNAQFGIGIDYNVSNFQLTTDNYSNQSNVYLDVNMFYNFNKNYGIQTDFKYLKQGTVFNNENFDIDFFQVPFYFVYSVGNDKNISCQINAGYYLKLPLKVSENMTTDFLNHGFSGKFLFVYQISEKANCLSGIEFSKDLKTSFINEQLKFFNFGVLFGLQILPFN